MESCEYANEGANEVMRSTHSLEMSFLGPHMNMQETTNELHEYS